jgi:hypothetical protein
VADDLGISRPTGFRWEKRRKKEGLATTTPTRDFIKEARDSEKEIRTYALQVALTMGGPKSPEYVEFVTEHQKTFPPIAFSLPIKAAEDLESASRLLDDMEKMLDGDGSITPEAVALTSKIIEHKRDISTRRMVLYEKYVADGMPSIMHALFRDYMGIDKHEQDGAITQVLAVLLAAKFGVNGDEFKKVRAMIGQIAGGEDEDTTR